MSVYRSTEISSGAVHQGEIFLRLAKLATLTIAPVAIAARARCYKELTGDAELYALQTFVSFHPARRRGKAGRTSGTGSRTSRV